MWLGTWTNGASAAVTTLKRLADRAAVTRHHPVKQIRGARLVALQDGVGEQTEGLVFADLVSVAEHRTLFPTAGADLNKPNACPAPS